MFHLGSEKPKRFRNANLVVRLKVSSNGCDAGKLMSFVFGRSKASIFANTPTAGIFGE